MSFVWSPAEASAETPRTEAGRDAWLGLVAADPRAKPGGAKGSLVGAGSAAAPGERQEELFKTPCNTSAF